MICGEFFFEDNAGDFGDGGSVGGSRGGGNGGNVSCGDGQEKTLTTNFDTYVVVLATVVGRIAKLKFGDDVDIVVVAVDKTRATTTTNDTTTTNKATNRAMKHINKQILPNHNGQPKISHHHHPHNHFPTITKYPTITTTLTTTQPTTMKQHPLKIALLHQSQIPPLQKTVTTSKTTTTSNALPMQPPPALPLRHSKSRFFCVVKT